MLFHCLCKFLINFVNNLILIYTITVFFNFFSAFFTIGSFFIMGVYLEMLFFGILCIAVSTLASFKHFGFFNTFCPISLTFRGFILGNLILLCNLVFLGNCFF